MKKHDCATVDLFLLGCVKTKFNRVSASKNLYRSTLWKYRRAYAEMHNLPWYILSAKHGFLDPESWIAPYDLTLADLPTAERRKWSQRTLDDLLARVPDLRGKAIEIHAGKPYVEHGLEYGLRKAGAIVLRPLKHVAGQGVQYKWYREHIGSCSSTKARENRIERF